MIRHSALLFLSLFIVNISCTQQQQQQDMNPEDTEVWEPVPKDIPPNGFVDKAPPSDATILFDGSSLDAWQSADGSSVKWEIKDENMTIVPGTKGIQTKQGFNSIQLHLEWRAPEEVEGEGQDRGNSGVFLQSRYELQVLDSYENETYSNGMAASIYKQHIPLVNAARKPGQWQSYDVVFIAPEFMDDGSLESPARMTVFWNGILVHHDVELEGPTKYIGHPEYEAHADKLPIMLQDHGSAVSYRNIWVREL